MPEEPLGIPDNEVLSPVGEPCAFTMVQRLGTREKSNEIHDLYIYESNNTENVGLHTKKATKTKPEQTEKNKHKKQQRKKRRKKTKIWGHRDTQVLFYYFLSFRVILPVSFFSRMRGPVSLWGFGGWVCVRLTLRNRSQPFTTIRVRSLCLCLWRVLQKWSFLEVSSVA